MKHLKLFNESADRNVLFFPSNSTKGSLKYYNLWKMLIKEFNGRDDVTVDEIDTFLNNISDERWYIKEKPYQFEIYDDASEYIFCINRYGIKK